MKEILDIINSDIKRCEAALADYPMTDEWGYRISENIYLYWNRSNKRIDLEVVDQRKNLLEWAITERTQAYVFLSKFFKFCIEKESKKFDLKELSDAHIELKETLKPYSPL